MTTETAPESPANTLREQLERMLLAPVRAFRIQYLPLLMVYFAYGAMGLVAVADSFWVRKELTLSPAALAQLGVWLTLPWTVKMVFGELVERLAAMGIDPLGALDRAPSLVEKRVWKLAPSEDDAVADAIDDAIAAVGE